MRLLLHIIFSSILLLLSGCSGIINTKANVPVWEFDLTINGVRSHFKSTGVEKDWLYLTQRLAPGAYGGVNGGKWTITCVGNSASDAEWQHGSPINVLITFDETSGQIESIISSGAILWYNIQATTPLQMTVNSYGSKSTVDQSTLDVDFGDPIELTISNQNASDLVGSISISGTIKAIY
jgi:hypothetical protein